MIAFATGRTTTVLAVCGLSAALMGAPADRDPQATSPAAPEALRLPPGWQLNRGPMGSMRTELTVAPDGMSLVFSASPDGTMEKARLYWRALDRADAAIIPGTPEGACMPSFSPDGQSIVYWAAKKLYKVAVKGGEPVALCDMANRPFGTSWAPDGRIIIGRAGAGLAYVPAAGGTPVALTTLDAAREESHRLPHVLPGGKGLLFTAMAANVGLETRLEWLSLETGQRKLLVEDAADGRYLPTGHLVFVRKGALMAVPFDPARLQTTGPVVTMVPRLAQALNTGMSDMNSGAGQYGVSDSGTLIWAAGGMLPDWVSQFYWVDRSGRAEPWSAFGTRAVGSIRLSPDGRRLAFNTVGFDRGIWIYDIPRNRATRLTSDTKSWFMLPFWTPDGRRVAFSQWRNGLHLWWTAADGTGTAEQLTHSDSDERAGSWTRDGGLLSFVSTGRETGTDIEVLRMADRRVTAFVATKAAETFPEFSPDGRWMAYVSNETGRNEVYVRSFPDGSRTLSISSGGGTSPAWGPDGHELFFWDIGFKKLMKVDISAGSNLSASTPRPLFEFAAVSSVAVRNYDITRDGQRFLIQKAHDVTPVPVTELNLVRRWFDEVKRLSAPAKQ